MSIPSRPPNYLRTCRVPCSPPCAATFTCPRERLPAEVATHTREKHAKNSLPCDVTTELDIQRCDCCGDYWPRTSVKKHCAKKRKADERRHKAAQEATTESMPPTLPPQQPRDQPGAPALAAGTSDNGRRVTRKPRSGPATRDPPVSPAAGSVQITVTIPPPSQHTSLLDTSDVTASFSCVICSQPGATVSYETCPHTYHSSCLQGSISYMTGACPLCPPLGSQPSSPLSLPIIDHTLGFSVTPTTQESLLDAVLIPPVGVASPSSSGPSASAPAAPTSVPPSLRCPVPSCGKSLKRRESLRDHLNAAHTPQQRQLLEDSVLREVHGLELCRVHCPEFKTLLKGGLEPHLQSCRNLDSPQGQRANRRRRSAAPTTSWRSHARSLSFTQELNELGTATARPLGELLQEIAPPTAAPSAESQGTMGENSTPSGAVDPPPGASRPTSGSEAGSPNGSLPVPVLAALPRPRSGKSPIPDSQLSGHVPSPVPPISPESPPRLVQRFDLAQPASPPPSSRVAEAESADAPHFTPGTIQFLREQYAARPSVPRKAPKEVLPSLINAARGILGPASDAERADDRKQLAHLTTEFLLLPRAALTSVRSGKRHRSVTIAHMKDRLANINAVREAAPARSSATPAAVTAHERSGRVLEGVMELIADGHLSAAASRLTQAEPTPVTHEVIEELRSLHPPSSEPLPPMPENAPRPLVTGEMVKAIIKERCRNGSAAGLSGWSGDLLYVLCSDQICLSGLTSIVRAMVHDKLDGTARDLLLASALTPIIKDLSKSAAGNLRPIAVSEVLYRAAMMTSVKGLEASDVVSHFEPLQLGTLSSCGVERAFHIAQARLERAAERREQDFVTLSIDVKNAFGTIKRSSVASALFSTPHLSPIWRSFRFAYSSPSPLCLYSAKRLTAILESSEGVRQGDPLSSLLFSVAIHDVYKQIRAISDELTVVGIQDDLTVSGPAALVLRALELFKQLTQPLGLTFNARKTWAYVVSPSESTVQALGRLGVEVVQAPQVKRLLGGPFGLDAGARAEWLAQALSEHRPLFDALADRRLPAQHAALVIRSCLLPRVSYWTRILDPAITDGAAATWDADLLALCLSRLDAAALLLPPEVVDRLRLPLSKGGYGIPSIRDRRLQSYLASVASAVGDLPFLDHTSTSNLVAQAASAHARLIQLTPSVSSDIAPDFAQFWSLYGSKENRPPVAGLQKKLTAAADVLAFTQLLSRLSAPEQASLRSASQSGSSRWLSVHPSSDKLTMESNDYVAAVWAYFMFPVPVRDNMRCPGQGPTCSAVLTSRDVVLHGLTCPCHDNPAFKCRHDLVKNGVIDVAEESRLEARPEVPVVSSDLADARRSSNVADVAIKFPDKPIHLLDVVITAPFASAALANHSATKPLVAASRAESDKCTAYAEVIRSRRVEFSPFAMECSGAMGESASAVVKRLAAAHSRAQSCSIAVSAAKIHAELSVALHKGNAAILLSFLNSIVPV